ncbi:sugar phosphate isomerase/epimerase [Marinomonas sp. UCMA 3892]|jgi:sugar phosphate isomerase/epimerase|uniref:Sugar phosphate isomerase/epimerase n=2 Tax=Marinomonas TaxID=28253 RepID=A0A1M5FN87_9GAMM|nr:MULTISPECIES: sugar phosphate isomerase/epimerase [Marinomonas]MBU1297225.1 sugar phosphate isomerase/epimerase [Gammaproteobacteria bacterium]MBU1468873.1 sugar phosphate isomerase/epimerase [Gammaproteobacteria bacterium]MBU2022036.1 sugar phosphate isomerase/epimerase [Gammaproteobacteria bacterium]MBU2320756.1 sugar phosphate isomerase/epimerase [Gammaproteobacteria bacterium]MBU2414609.1 sugar phosphate isomerase/epimerase [Gammaproteobacteria bacterium]|tara:strand:- start:6331 stop:7095 length:765 start_codon:yes stop_codon:yes gene_type:complete
MNEFSFQLYSARNTKSLDEVFALLHQAGYQQVEGYGGLYGQLDELKSLLEKHQLTMPTGHFDLTMLENNIQQALYIAKTLNMHTIICPYILPDQRPDNAQGWFELGQRLEAIREKTINAGFEFGWHNHNFEFEALADGSLPMTQILEGGPNIKWEMDVSWVVKGGQDPIEWLTKYRDRICAVHLKDIAPEGECQDEDGWADFTHGTLPWREWWPVVRSTPASAFVMEHDNPNDLSRFANRALTGAKALLKGATV